MSSAPFVPKTLLEVVRYFADEQTAFEHFRDQRWPNGVSCPRCGSGKVRFMPSQTKWNCNGCRRQFSVKVGTIFEDSPIKLSVWLPAMWLLGNAKNGISSCELARSLGVTQKTAWLMLHRIRLAMQNGAVERLQDHVEVHETYIGGKARNIHKHVRAQKIKGTGGAGSGKAIVVGMLERGGLVKLTHVNQATRETLQGLVKAGYRRARTSTRTPTEATLAFPESTCMASWTTRSATSREAFTRTVWRTSGLY